MRLAKSTTSVDSINIDSGQDRCTDRLAQSPVAMYECQKGTQFCLPSFMIEPHYTDAINN